ncbi:hypothetical protein [Massilia sp. S19_KUP03_FR1]|uniref:hypothetical protein n=1 Tax=Massilia sp. S19_KUP03_FR1 TaxID=3025503 RepID=UPI002FCD26D2
MQLFPNTLRSVAATALAAAVSCAQAQVPAPKPHVQILQLNSICSSGATWEEADTVTVNFPNENVTLSVNRFDDALHVKIRIGQEEREMIRLDNGLTAVRASNELGPPQFAGVDLLANAALHYLQQGFKTPCAASNAHHFSLDIQDGPKSDANTVHMEGDMEQTGEALGYGMIVTEREGPANATILKTTGSWDFADLGDIPDTTSIVGWRVYRNGERMRMDDTDLTVIEDLKRLARR